VFVTVPPVLATVLQDMKVLLARELFAQITAMTAEHAGLRKFWLPRLIDRTQLLGMR
jgi:hypothetical protein